MNQPLSLAEPVSEPETVRAPAWQKLPGGRLRSCGTALVSGPRAWHTGLMGLSLARIGGTAALAASLVNAFVGSGCGPKKATTITPESEHAGTASGGDAGDSGGNRSAAGAASGGGNSRGGSSGGGPVTELDDFFEQEGKGFCERSFRCFEGNDDFSTAHLILQTLARCQQLVERINATGAAQRDARAQLAAGALHVVPEQAKRCLQDLAACNGPNNLDDGSCRDVLEGRTELGQPCQRSVDCVGDAYCDASMGCPGTCVARKPEGAECTLDDECSYSEGVLSCYHGMSGKGVCHTQAWAPKAAKGEPCTRRLSPAAEVTVCEDDLWCDTAPGGDPNEDVMGVCALPIGNGMPCRDSDDVCLTGVCNTDTLKCEPVKVATAVGDACNKEELVICDPLRGLVCGKDLKCHGSGDGSSGSACFNSDYQLGCGPGLYCDRSGAATSDVPGTCRPLNAAGQACTADSACESDLCSADKTCATRGCFR
ncbi:MAG TPA: hypothetical protein VHB79_20530 [Polyangiaceae bacterium]|nr:hypothetical protein [Polyangiaceae bacterium]